MIIDHVGLMFFPKQMAFRFIGRIAFPIFAFLIVQGYLHTSNVKKYLLRLFLSALVSEIPYNLFVHRKFFYFGSQNVMFTLFLGLLAILAIDKLFKEHKILALASALLCCCTAYFIKADYKIFGVLLIISLFVFSKNKFLSLGSLAFLNVGYSLIMGIYLQISASLACIPIAFYNGKLGKYKLKWLFYLFYPVHMLILYFIWLMLSTR